VAEGAGKLSALRDLSDPGTERGFAA
jgi:hypothetical protein